jgi:hypothetical protein
VARTFEAVRDFSLPNDIEEDLLKLFLKRIELAGDPSKEEDQADYHFEDVAKHFVIGRRLFGWEC